MSPLRHGLLVLWEQQQPVSELRRASPPAPAALFGGVSFGPHRAGRGVSALPPRLPRVPPHGALHRYAGSVSLVSAAT